MPDHETFAGVDVGGRRKGFDVAIIDSRGALVGTGKRLDTAQAAELVRSFAPTLVAIDSPCSAAPPGARTRDGERQLSRALCGIRWTPDERTLAEGDYYDWVRRGRALYDLLADRRMSTIEVFPTASWTRWHGPRARRRRSAWSHEALMQLGVGELPARTSQDLRDAVAAAVTAYQHVRGDTESFGEIVVPKAARAPRFAT